MAGLTGKMGGKAGSENPVVDPLTGDKKQNKISNIKSVSMRKPGRK